MNDSKDNKTLLIADDHPIFRQGLKHVLEILPWLKIIGEADDGNSALLLIDRLRPDIVLLDLAMPGSDGLTVLEESMKKRPDQVSIIVTSYDDSAYLDRALELGAKGYMVKDSAAENLVQCLNTVLAGELFISPSLGGKSSKLPGGSTPDISRLDRLTKTERTVLSLVGKCMTSKEIAAQLNVSFRTVQNHRAHICEKLGLRGTNQLMNFAIENRGRIDNTQ